MHVVKGTQAMGEAVRNLSLAFPSLTKLQLSYSVYSD